MFNKQKVNLFPPLSQAIKYRNKQGKKKKKKIFASISMKKKSLVLDKVRPKNSLS